ncbi:MAG: hypothetical protein K0U16_07845 [Gammaproteobacteria bacterium]|nr:hypothetical protein [Gammaproteobacteria bacterium]
MSKPIFETALEEYTFPTGGKLFHTEEIRDRAFVVLRGRQDDQNFAEVCQSKLGITLPAPLMITERITEKATEHQKITCLWMAPDEFLLIMPQQEKNMFLSTAAAAFKDLFAVAIDNSGTYSYLRLSGEKLQEVLAKVTLYDTSMRGLPPGKVVGTVIGKSQIIVFRKEGQQSIDLLVRFSFADYVWGRIALAAKEYQPDILAK